MLDFGELALKHRPKDFNEFYGNELIIKSLESVLDRDWENIPRKYIFIGPSGIGKTTLGSILKLRLGCSEIDFHYFNISNMSGVDTARQIEENCLYAPKDGKCKIYLLDEVQKASNSFQNSILNILEDPPLHVFFILCTTESNKLLSTIKGQRGITYNLKSVNKNILCKLIKDVLKKEDCSFNDDVIQYIAEYADGSPRKALVILEKIIDIDVKDEDLFKIICEELEEEKTVIDLCRLFLSKKFSWSDITKILKNIQGEPETIRIILLSYMSKVLLSKENDMAKLVIDEFSKSFFYSKKAGLISACYSIYTLLK